MKSVIKVVGFLLLTPWAAMAALPATATINIQSTATASNVNAGIFDTASGGTNYTLQDAAQVSGTDGTSNASTNFNSAAQTFTSQMVGNYINLISGTNALVARYRITAFVDAHNVTLEANSSSGAMTNGVFNLGGALVSLEDAILELGVAGNIFYMKTGSYALPSPAITLAATGGASNPILIKGYTTTHGDACTGSNRPVIGTAAAPLTAAITLAANWDVYNLNLTGNGTSVILAGSGGKTKNVRAVNVSTTAARAAFLPQGDSLTIDCEAVSYRGIGVSLAAVSGAQVQNCYIHDSDVGVNSTATSGIQAVNGNIIESCVTKAINWAGAMTGAFVLSNNTLFGSTNTTGTGIAFVSGVTDVRVINNIITGFVTGISHADTTQTVGYDSYNDYYNNDTDVSGWVKNPLTSIAIAPSFTSVGQVTGATATTTATNHLVQSGATFVSSGVTAGRDFVYIISGTGVTAGIYGIASVDSETQITTDISLSANATADKVFQITTGRNFSPGSAVKALGAPGVFQGGYTTSFVEPGAVQRQEGAGNQSSSASVK